MKAFELQTYRNGQWQIQGVFNDYELALFEAKRVEETNRFPSIRIIEETYNEATNMTRSRTVFRGGQANNQEAEDLKREKEARLARRRARLRSGGASKAARKARRRYRDGTSAVVMPVLVLSIIVLSGLAALISLQNIFRQL